MSVDRLNKLTAVVDVAAFVVGVSIGITLMVGIDRHIKAQTAKNITEALEKLRIEEWDVPEQSKIVDEFEGLQVPGLDSKAVKPK